MSNLLLLLIAATPIPRLLATLAHKMDHAFFEE